MHFNEAGIVCFLFSLLLYINTFQGEFVYDDRRAIVQNPNVVLQTPLSSLFVSDYWGLALNHSGSHGSYRPLTVLTFRLNFILFGLNPFAYHVTNVMLHCVTSYLFCLVLMTVLNQSKSKTFAAGLLFASHPIHTEAVAGIVGRADILATLFCLTTLASYKKVCDHLRMGQRVSALHPVEQRASTVSTVQTLTHKHRKVAKKVSKKRNASKSSAGKFKKSRFRFHNLDPDSRVKDEKLVLEGTFPPDSGALTDDSCGTTDTYDSLTSSSSVVSEEGLVKEEVHTFEGENETQFNLEPNTERKSKLVPIKANEADQSLQGQVNSTKSLSVGNRAFGYLWFGATLSSAVCALLSKENGYCAIPMCIVYDVFVRHNMWEKRNIQAFVKWKPIFKSLRRRTLALLCFWIALMAFRVGLPGALSTGRVSFPDFSPSDNPAASCPSFLTRAMTFNYLMFCNVQMLFFPVTLNFDWSMDAIPLVTSLGDVTNAATAALYAAAFVLAKSAFKRVLLAVQGRRRSTDDRDDESVSNAGCFYRRSSSTSSEESLTDFRTDDNHNYTKDARGAKSRLARERRARSYRAVSDFTLHSVNVNKGTDCTVEKFLFGFAIIALSLLPASNLFFYVGFVLAERLLYLPSIGSCILLVEGGHFLIDTINRKYGWSEDRRRVKPRKKTKTQQPSLDQILAHVIRHGWIVMLIIFFSVKTVARNWDWKNEISLYRSGTSINPAKSLGNLGNALRSQGNVADAELAYKKALEHRPNMADVHYNLGLLYQESDRRQMAEESYRLAIQFRPAMALAHLNLGVVLAQERRTEEAKVIYRRAADVKNEGTKDPRTHVHAQLSALFNLGCLLADEGRHEEAVAVYEEAVSRPLDRQYKPHSLYNMLGQSLLNLGRLEKAEEWFKASLSSKPDHVPAHLTYAQLLARQDRTQQAKALYEQALKLEAENKEIYIHYGSFLLKTNQPHKAALLLHRAASSTPGENDYEIISSAASAFRQARKYDEAEDFYHKAVKLAPNIASSHLNLGAILHLRKKYDLAKQSYKRALKLDPGNELILQNLSKLNLNNLESSESP